MHCHSTLSDGKNSPWEIISEAERLGLDFLALTDHDVIAPKNFQKDLKEVWIKSCDSVEISARNYELGKSLHLVSYACTFSDSLRDILDESRRGKLKMKTGQLELLVSQYGFIWTVDGFEAFLIRQWRTLEGSNKYDLARYLARNLDNKTKMKYILWDLLEWNDVVNSFYKECFKREWSLYDTYGYEVDDYEPSVETTIEEVVKKSRWIVSMAHPNVTFDESKWWIPEFEKTIENYVDKWLNAIEINTQADAQWVHAILAMRQKYNLILTRWSDCHMIWYDGRDGKHGTIWQKNPHLDSADVWKKIWRWASFSQVDFERFQDQLWI